MKAGLLEQVRKSVEITRHYSTSLVMIYLLFSPDLPVVKIFLRFGLSQTD